MPTIAVKYGYVTENIVSVYNGPGTNYPKVATVSIFYLIKLLSSAGEWYEIKSLDGKIKGWINMSFIHIFEEPFASAGWVIDAKSINVRTGPGIQFDPIGFVYFGDQIKVVGLWGDTWCAMESLDGTRKGWVSTKYVITGLDYFSLYGIVNARESVYIRKGPGKQYDIVTSINFATNILLLGLDEDVKWYKMKTKDGKIQGWVSKKYVDLIIGRYPDQ